MKILNMILCVAGVLAVGIVLSGYKEDFTTLQYGNYPTAFTDSFINDEIPEKKGVCDPGFNCRRINFYCSLTK